MQNGAGAMALATLTNIVLLPGHLALLPVVIPAIGPRMQAGTCPHHARKNVVKGVGGTFDCFLLLFLTCIAAMTDAMDKVKAADDAWEKKSSGKGGESDRK